MGSSIKYPRAWNNSSLLKPFSNIMKEETSVAKQSVAFKALCPLGYPPCLPFMHLNTEEVCIPPPITTFHWSFNCSFQKVWIVSSSRCYYKHCVLGLQHWLEPMMKEVQHCYSHNKPKEIPSDFAFLEELIHDVKGFPSFYENEMN